MGADSCPRASAQCDCAWTARMSACSRGSTSGAGTRQQGFERSELPPLRCFLARCGRLWQISVQRTPLEWTRSSLPAEQSNGVIGWRRRCLQRDSIHATSHQPTSSPGWTPKIVKPMHNGWRFASRYVQFREEQGRGASQDTSVPIIELVKDLPRSAPIPRRVLWPGARRASRSSR